MHSFELQDLLNVVDPTNEERRQGLLKMGGRRCGDADCDGYEKCSSWCFKETERDKKIMAVKELIKTGYHAQKES